MLPLVWDLFRPDNLAVAVAVAAALLWLQLFQLLVCARLQHNVAVPVAVQMRLLSLLLPWLAWALLSLLTFRIVLRLLIQVSAHGEASKFTAEHFGSLLEYASVKHENGFHDSMVPQTKSVTGVSSKHRMIQRQA